MNKELKEFMQRRFPAGSRIKIDHILEQDDIETEKLIGRTFIVNSVEDNGLKCTEENGSDIMIQPEKCAFYKLDQPPVLAYSCGEEPAELTNVRQMAEFIVNNGLNGDISMYSKDTGEFVLSTMGIFLDRIADMEFRSELLTILVPLQQQYPFGMPEEESESIEKEIDDNSNGEKKTFDYNGTEVYFEIGYYFSDPTAIALAMFTKDDEEYGTLTVNLRDYSDLGPNQAFIDTNNMLYAEKFLESLNGAKRVEHNGVPVTARSGFCEYPLYEFDESFLADIDPSGYTKYIQKLERTNMNEDTDECMEMGGLS